MKQLKIWSVLVSVFMLLTFFAVPAAAATHSHPVCGAVCTHEETHGTMTASPWSGGTFSDGHNYYLSSDVTVSTNISVTGTVKLCLNGHTLTFAEGYGLRVAEDGNFELCDCVGSGGIARGQRTSSGDSGILYNVGSMTVYGGNYCLDGEGVSFSNDGTLVIYDGTFGISLNNYARVTIYQAKFDTRTDAYYAAIGNSGSLTIYNCDIISGGTSIRNTGTASLHGGKYRCANETIYGGSTCIDNEGTMYVYDGELSSVRGHGIVNSTTVTNTSYGSKTNIGKVYIYNGKITSGDNRAAVFNTGSLTVSGGTLGGYIGIQNDSVWAGGTKDGGTCTVSGGAVSGSHCGILNSGGTSTIYQNGKPYRKEYSKGILTISGSPSISKIILEYANALTFNYAGTQRIDMEIDMDDFAVGETAWSSNKSKLPLVNLVNEGHALLYDYSKGIYLASANIGANNNELYWDLSADGTLTIYGTGNMKGFGSRTSQPWNNQKTFVDVMAVNIQPGVTSIGSAAFAYLENVTEIDIPEGVTSIGSWAFEHTYALKKLFLPSTLTKIDDNIFAGVDGIPEEIHYAGCIHQWNSVTVADQGQQSFTPICLPNTNVDDGDSGTALLCSVCGGVDIPAKIAVTVTVPGSDNSGAVVTAPENGWQPGTNTFSVSCVNPCVVAVSYDGGETYVELTATAADSGYSVSAENMTADTVVAVAVRGDANGDGKITNADVTRLRAAFMGKTTVDALTQLAIDANCDGKVTNADVTRLRAAFFGKTNLSW